MKKAAFFALAAAAVFAFAACSDEEQDVNVVSTITDRSQSYTQYYTATGTKTITTVRESFTEGTAGEKTTSVKTYTAATTKTSPASISWTDSTLTNCTKYSVSVPATYKEDDNTPSSLSVSETVYGYGAQYYAENRYASYNLPAAEVKVDTSISAYTSEVSYKWSDEEVYYVVNYNDYYSTLPSGTTTYVKYTVKTVDNFTLTKIAD